MRRKPLMFIREPNCIRMIPGSLKGLMLFYQSPAKAASQRTNPGAKGSGYRTYAMIAGRTPGVYSSRLLRASHDSRRSLGRAPDIASVTKWPSRGKRERSFAVCRISIVQVPQRQDEIGLSSKLKKLHRATTTFLTIYHRELMAEDLRCS